LYCNGPLPRVGSSASSTRLLARQSLFGDGPVLTGTIRNKDRRRCNNEHTRTLSGNLPTAHVNNHTVLRLRSSCLILHTVASVFFLFIFCRRNLISSVHVRCTLLKNSISSGTDTNVKG
ncbi:hypothetical protein T02_1296, partial [Trichinella nativa]